MLVNKTKTATSLLALGALGIVFGDIGTSPLYALPAIFGPLGQHLAINTTNVHGIISLIFWSITLVVSIKYIYFIMRADNEGEGGIIALIGLIKNSKLPKKVVNFFIIMGLIGVALFYGDSLITPAISVLSAVEGVHVIAPELSRFVIPVTLIILAFLFFVQKYGTGAIGNFFGPIMLCWFLTIGAGGAWQVWQHPYIINALSPISAFNFVVGQPILAFVAMGAVILAITGAEALYADMGHFGRKSIAKAWFVVVFPALTLCYMGQGALLLNNSSTISNPLLLLFPSSLQVTVVMLATAATLIASQAVISGAFSLTRQAVHLDFLPKMLIRHTSDSRAGQVYLPFINLLLFIGVTLLVVVFGGSQRLANAFGMAVSVTLAVDTILFMVVLRGIQRRSLGFVIILLPLFLTIDLVFVTSNSLKLFRGGWFPLTVAIAVIIIITTWLKGRKIINKERSAKEGSLQAYVDELDKKLPPVSRVPGHAVYIGHHSDLTPLALHAVVEQLHELHEKATIVSVQVRNIAHVSHDERAVFDDLGNNTDGLSHLTLYYGYHDSINIPKTLESLRKLSSEIDFDPYTASYFVSLAKVVPTRSRTMARWRKSLFCIMSNSATNPSDYFKLPVENTVEMRTLIKL